MFYFHSKVSLPLINRLKLTREKLNALSAGIRSIALQEDPIDQVYCSCYAFHLLPYLSATTRIRGPIDNITK